MNKNIAVFWKTVLLCGMDTDVQVQLIHTSWAQNASLRHRLGVCAGTMAAIITRHVYDRENGLCNERNEPKLGEMSLFPFVWLETGTEGSALGALNPLEQALWKAITSTDYKWDEHLSGR